VVGHDLVSGTVSFLRTGTGIALILWRVGGASESANLWLDVTWCPVHSRVG
jgi:hypothetical protein